MLHPLRTRQQIAHTFAETPPSLGRLAAHPRQRRGADRYTEQVSEHLRQPPLGQVTRILQLHRRGSHARPALHRRTNALRERCPRHATTHRATAGLRLMFGHLSQPWWWQVEDLPTLGLALDVVRRQLRPVIRTTLRQVRLGPIRSFGLAQRRALVSALAATGLAGPPALPGRWLGRPSAGRRLAAVASGHSYLLSPTHYPPASRALPFVTAQVISGAGAWAVTENLRFL